MKIVVKQVSGLGNQLSQYAAGLYYADRYGAQLEIAIDPDQRAVSHGYPRPFLLSRFSITAPFHPATRQERFLLTQRKVLAPWAALCRRIAHVQVLAEKIEQRYTFVEDVKVRAHTRALYLVGYWQSYHYPARVESKLRREFACASPPEGRNLETLRQIQKTKTSISIHIRRGDYALQAEGNIVLPLEYYDRALRYIKERCDSPHFFVFSDDIDFAKRSLPPEPHMVFVDHNDAYTAHEDLRLMSSCTHHIIANSTFSWWAAWLNPRSDKIVISPRYWHIKPGSYFPDLLPPEWILLGDNAGDTSQG